MASNPLRDWSSGLLLLGTILLVFAVGLSAAEFLTASTGARTYPFSSAAPGGVLLSIVLVAAGLGLRALAEPRRPSPHPRLERAK